MCKLKLYQSAKTNALTHKTMFFGVFLLACCLSMKPVYAGSGSGGLPNVLSIYVFSQNDSTLTQTGGPGSISETYPIQGLFEFYGYYSYNSVYFYDTNAVLTRTTAYLPSQYLNDIFNFAGLSGYFINSTTIYMSGTTTDGTDSTIALTMYFNGDSVTLVGTITPPDDNPDAYSYQLSANAVRKYGGGTGAFDNPFLITTPEHMNTIGLNPQDWNKSFKLTQDISLSAYKSEQFNIIGYYRSETDKLPFSGIFDGNNKKILNFYYSSSTLSRIGLFGYLNGNNLQIKKLGIVEPDINAANGSYIGALAGQLEKGSITNCYVQGGHVSGAGMVGGLLGRNGSKLPVTDIEGETCIAGIIQYCSAGTNVNATTDTGGLVGSNDGIITDCSSTSVVTGFSKIGGLTGFNGSVVMDCNTNASVSGNKEIGALVGRNFGIICTSNSKGSAEGQENIGGIAGFNNGGYIKFCSSASTIDGVTNAGGIAGSNGGNISGSSASGIVTGNLYVGGCVGRNYWRISNTFSTADVDALFGYAGGLTGTNEANGMIQNCYSSAITSGPLYVGGLLGNNDGAVLDCYSTGVVVDSNTADNLSIGFGGLIGNSTTQACTFLSFWDTQTSGRQTSAGGTGKSTVDMKNKATYTDWGKSSTEINWTILQGTTKDYPRLLWENKPGNTIAPILISTILTGSGTEASPYLISTADQLNAIGLFTGEWDKSYRLGANVNMSGLKYNMIGFYRMPFTGIFDGNNKVISNLTISSIEQSYVGLFGCIGSLAAQVKNLGMSNTIIDAADNVGSLAGYLKEGVISNCNAQNVDITGSQYVAGLVGFNQVTIKNCYSTGFVKGNTDAGGLAGSNSEGAVIDQCHSECSVSGDSDIGGLTGINEGTIKTCVTTSNISANSIAGGITGLNTGTIDNSHSSGYMSGYGMIGGLAGSNNGIVTNSYSSAPVYGDYSVGGLTGFNLNATITNCYATGNVYGRLNAGGLAGQCFGTTSITSSYANNNVAGDESVGGLVGSNASSINKCYSRGTVSGTEEVGGLVGWNLASSSITNSYSRCSVLASQWAGGLVGINSGSINKCYSSGIVTGTNLTIGGLVALNYSTVSASFWDTETSGQATSSGGTGKTTANMKTKANYTSAGWDFTSTWKITENQDYPKLSFETN